MSGVRRMHADELDIDAGLVRRLLVAQFPQWADLRIERVAWAGTDNAIFRLGTDLAALPYYANSNPVIVDWARRQVDSVLADNAMSGT